MPLPPLNLLVMVDLPLVHKDTTSLGDVKATQTCVSCGTGEEGSPVRLRTTRTSPCLPYLSLPLALIGYMDWRKAQYQTAVDPWGLTYEGW